MSFSVYLAGEIHTDWREEIRRGAEAAGLDVVFTAPVTDHPASDAAGDHLGETGNQFWRDHQSAKVNSIRTRTLIEQADMAVVRFGDKYKQWNAAFDAGQAAALGKPLITLHPPDHDHALKAAILEQDWPVMGTTACSPSCAQTARSGGKSLKSGQSAKSTISRGLRRACSRRRSPLFSAPDTAPVRDRHSADASSGSRSHATAVARCAG